MTHTTKELILNNPVGGASINNIEVSALRTDDGVAMLCALQTMNIYTLSNKYL